MTRARRAAIVSGTTILALACGVAVGAGPLSGSDDDTAQHPGASGKASGKPDEFVSTFAADGGAALAKNGLKSVNAVIITLPGAPDTAVNGVSDGLDKAGAHVTGTVALQPKLLSASNRQFSVGVAEQSAKIKADDYDGDYDVVGSALAEAFIRKKPAELNDRQRTISSAFVDAGLLATTDAPDAAAEMVVFIAGPHAPEGGGDILASLVKQLNRAGKGAVIAGPGDAGASGAGSDDDASNGYVQSIRTRDMDVSTFDKLDSPAGQRAVALIAIRELKGKSGSYGSETADDGPYPR